MRIVCVGGGPAGLYFAVLAKLADPTHEVTVLERNPPQVTYGWGVVYWDDLLDDLFRWDPVSARMIWDASYRWDQYEVRAAGKPVTYLGGYGFSLSRHVLLDILGRRATQLGVDVRYEQEVKDAGEYPDADLIVAGDGAGSRIRSPHEVDYGTRIETGGNKYIWLGTSNVFTTFTFAFEETAAGWIWFHAYPFTGRASTCIVECTPQTWAGLGFDRLGPEETVASLEGIFAAHLNGHPLIDQRASSAGSTSTGSTGWLNFRHLSNERWHRENVVLMGDAAHTAHFAIGSGTKMAIQDAMGLARALRTVDSLPEALTRYGKSRRAAVAPLQRAARASSEWFENTARYIGQPATEFSYSLSNRRGDYPYWRSALHAATQRVPVRAALRWGLTARKWGRHQRRVVGARGWDPRQPSVAELSRS